MLGIDQSGSLNAKCVLGLKRPLSHVCFRKPLPSAAQAHTIVGWHRWRARRCFHCNLCWWLWPTAKLSA